MQTKQTAPNDITAWLILHLAPFIKPSVLQQSLQHFSSPQHLCKLDKRTLQQWGFSDAAIAAILQPDWNQLEKILHWAAEPHHSLLCLSDTHYPTLLRETTNPPLLLYIDGNPALLNTPQIAVVGSRKASHLGKALTYHLTLALSHAGLVITSGLALGVDGVSHAAAVGIPAPTIAVMATGIDIIYPRQHAALADKIREHGAIISEFPPLTPPKAFHFPQRNRIISGLSLAVLVVEAGLQSGSLITARLAAEQGRDVFAVPGSITNPIAAGCHYLIQQGAKLVTCPDDILAELPHDLLNPVATELKMTPSKQTKLDKDHRKLLECIGFDMLRFEQLVDRTGFSTQKVSAMLCNLTLNGYIKEEIGGYSRATL